MFTPFREGLSLPMRIRGALLAAFCLSVVMASPARADDPVLEWNDIARQLIVVPAQAPVQQTRAMAIVHVAMHDAVSGVTREYEQHHPTVVAPSGATPEGAAIGAAYGALVGLFGSSTALSDEYAESLVTHGIDPADPGLAYGWAVGQSIAAARQLDGSAVASFPYQPENMGLPGVWDPLGAAALLPGWGQVTPFVLRKASQFRPGPPPALPSERYARDYDEVQELGAAVGSTRTDEQTHIAAFWRASPTALWNPILRQAISSRDLSITDTARLAALFYMAASDASVACWDAKYAYNYWRPQAAIRAGDLDRNRTTAGDADWRPLVPTPPHPEYPSAHATNSAAMAAVLSAFFGDQPGFVIEASSSTNPGFTREWLAFSEGVQEVIDARVYSGIHFRTADVEGAWLGRQVAHFVLVHALGRARRP
jgi:membrane-associated phospholipid phosphatase